jgi:hypothetical protein
LVHFAHLFSLPKHLFLKRVHLVLAPEYRVASVVLNRIRETNDSYCLGFSIDPAHIAALDLASYWLALVVAARRHPPGRLFTRCFHNKAQISPIQDVQNWDMGLFWQMRE